MLDWGDTYNQVEYLRINIREAFRALINEDTLWV